MARLALEHALPAGWVDEMFEAHRQRQHSRELLFSTVVDHGDDPGQILTYLGRQPAYPGFWPRFARLRPRHENNGR